MDFGVIRMKCLPHASLTAEICIQAGGISKGVFDAKGRERWSGIKNVGDLGFFSSCHHFHANVAIDTVHKDVAKNCLLDYEYKKGGITIHRGNGLGYPLLPTQKVGGRLLRKISLCRKGF